MSTCRVGMSFLSRLFTVGLGFAYLSVATLALVSSRFSGLNRSKNHIGLEFVRILVRS